MLSVRPSACNNSATIDRSYVKFDVRSFRKSAKKNQDSLKSDKNNGYFTCRSKYIDHHISLDSSDNDKSLRQGEVLDNII